MLHHKSARFVLGSAAHYSTVHKGAFVFSELGSALIWIFAFALIFLTLIPAAASGKPHVFPVHVPLSKKLKVSGFSNRFMFIGRDGYMKHERVRVQHRLKNRIGCVREVAIKSPRFSSGQFVDSAGIETNEGCAATLSIPCATHVCNIVKRKRAFIRQSESCLERVLVIQAIAYAQSESWLRLPKIGISADQFTAEFIGPRLIYPLISERGSVLDIDRNHHYNLPFALLDLLDLFGFQSPSGYCEQMVVLPLRNSLRHGIRILSNVASVKLSIPHPMRRRSAIAYCAVDHNVDKQVVYFPQP